MGNRVAERYQFLIDGLKFRILAGQARIEFADAVLGFALLGDVADGGEDAQPVFGSGSG